MFQLSTKKYVFQRSTPSKKTAADWSFPGITGNDDDDHGCCGCGGSSAGSGSHGTQKRIEELLYGSTTNKNNSYYYYIPRWTPHSWANCFPVIRRRREKAMMAVIRLRIVFTFTVRMMIVGAACCRSWCCRSWCWCNCAGIALNN